MENLTSNTGSQAAGKLDFSAKKKLQILTEPKPPFEEQKQKSPGLEARMQNHPRFEAPLYRPAEKLVGKVALITGDDSGIGRAVAVLYAQEGADVAISYLPIEQEDALETKKRVESYGARCILLPGDLANPEYCAEVVDHTVQEFGKLDILVSNAAYQRRKESLEEISLEEWDRTFRVNIYAYFLLTKEAVKHMKPGSAIIATSSETAHLGPKDLADYSATKGALNTFTKSLAQMLVKKGIRVNAVAAGPVWTPLNVADEGASEEKVRNFGGDQPIKRPAQPEEIAPAYVFLASDADSSYVTGAILAETGGVVIQ